MVAKLTYGGSFGSTEANTIGIRIIDEVNFPAYLVAKMVNIDGALDDRYKPFDEVMVREYSITDNPVIFRGKVENTSKAIVNGVEIITITARDNLAELNVSFNDATYSQNGADATINAIIRGHVKNVVDNFALPAIDSNNAAYESSLQTGAIPVIGKNNGRSVLKTIQDLAAEDPWNGTWSSVTNTGWHFYLDGGADMHYHQNGAYPSAPIGDGLRLKFGLAAGSVSDFYKEVLPSPSYSDFADDIVSEVFGHYQFDGNSQVVRLKLITFTNYDNSSGPFAAGNNISGTAEGGSGTATAQIRLVLSGALLVSHATDYTAEAPNFNPSVTITDATSGATATYTTTPGQESDQAKPVNLRRSTLVFNGASAASALSSVSTVAYAVARAGFIDVSADTHRKATIRIFDFPIFRRSSTTTTVRAGNQIYLEDAITPVSGSAVAENLTISKIEYVQEAGKSISSLSLTTNEGLAIRTSGVERVETVAKDSRVEAVDALISTSNVYTALDGAYNAPSITFDGSAGGDTGLFLFESGATEYMGVTADGSLAAYFGENNAGIWFYENLLTPNTGSSGVGVYVTGNAANPWHTVSANNYDTVSDERVKDNIISISDSNSLGFITKFTPRSFNLKGESETKYGLIAQEVKSTLDELGISNWSGHKIATETEDQIQTLDMTQFIAPLMGAVKELKKRLEKLEGEQ